MKTAVRAILCVAFALAIWRVYEVRGRLSAEDADPAAVAEMKQRLASLPDRIGNGAYTGEAYPVDEDVIRKSGADSFSSKVFTDARGYTYRVYIGGAVRNQENFHAPSYCMPSQGWDVVEQNTVPLAARPLGGPDARMRRLLLQYGSQRMVVYYWFQAGASTADHEFAIRWFRFLDLLRGAPLRPTLIVTIYVPITGTVEETEQRTRAFLRALGPVLRDALVAGKS